VAVRVAAVTSAENGLMQACDGAIKSLRSVRRSPAIPCWFFEVFQKSHAGLKKGANRFGFTLDPCQRGAFAFDSGFLGPICAYSSFLFIVWWLQKFFY
jgi:hypothetical protein